MFYFKAIFIFIYLFLATLCNMLDLSSPTRDQTCPTFTGSTESPPLDHREVPGCNFSSGKTENYSWRPGAGLELTCFSECRSLWRDSGSEFYPNALGCTHTACSVISGGWWRTLFLGDDELSPLEMTVMTQTVWNFRLSIGEQVRGGGKAALVGALWFP